MNRQDFFREAFKLVLTKGAAFLEEPDVPASLKVRPPGAYPSEKTFLKLCTGCDACMAACPVNAILIDDLEKRKPFLDPENKPCIHCPGYPCISACPTGALHKEFGTYLRLLSN